MRRGQEVGRAERAERELATDAADLLSEGHSPTPFALVTALFLPAPYPPEGWLLDRTGGAPGVPP